MSCGFEHEHRFLCRAGRRGQGLPRFTWRQRRRREIWGLAWLRAAKVPERGWFYPANQGTVESIGPIRACADEAMRVSNLANLRPEQIVKLYARRMGIEESLRDAKNLRSGMGLTCTLSRSKARFDNLVLLNILSMLFAWLIGAGADGHVLDYQANSIKDRRVLSFIFLGRRFARKPPPQRLKAWLASALTALQAGINTLEVAP